MTLVQSIDLYQLLAAADAHIGIYSTVLTEAVMTATPNLMFAALATADLLGYVAAGVAVPVRSGADVLAALARPMRIRSTTRPGRRSSTSTSSRARRASGSPTTSWRG